MTFLGAFYLSACQSFEINVSYRLNLFFMVFIACECLNFVQGYPVTVYQFTETQKIVIIPFSAIYLSSRMKQTEKALY